MKSFLLYKNKPLVKWGNIPDGYFYEGKLPGKDYALAVCPTNEKQIILDVDVKNGKNGYTHIPEHILFELTQTFWYNTKSGGAHYFLNYTGDKFLLNKSTEYGLDLRIGKNQKTGHNGGYVKYNYHIDIRECMHSINPTSIQLNKWLEELFCK